MIEPLSFGARTFVSICQPVAQTETLPAATHQLYHPAQIVFDLSLALSRRSFS